eukprot:4175805-Pyramimonas_sp.AAC.1
MKAIQLEAALHSGPRGHGAPRRGPHPCERLQEPARGWQEPGPGGGTARATASRPATLPPSPE